MMRTTASLVFVLGSILAGCTSASGGADDNVVPTLTVTSPTRGTTADAGTVTVTGSVTGSHVAVTVNGTAATVNADGSFSAQVAVDTGITILETHATDTHNHDLRDVRAVLAGTLQTSDGTVSAPLAAHAGAPALRAIGNAMAQQAEGIDFTAEVQKANPVYNNGGCLGAVVNVTSVSLSNIGIAVKPGDGVLNADVAIDDLVVKAHADYKAACIGGSTTITLKSSTAHIRGDMGVSLDASGKLVASLPDDSVVLDNFSFDVGGLPSAVENLVKDQVRDKVQQALADAIKNKAPGLANSALGSLVAKPLGTNLLGKQTDFAIAPSFVDISTAGGLYVEMQSTISVAGGEGGMYAATGATASPDLLAGTQGLGLAVANDSVNSLLAGLWGAGALDQHLDASSLGALQGLLDASVASLDVHFSLPPTVSTGASSTLALALGDVILTGKDASGNPVQTVALSVSTTVTAGPTQSGKLALVVGQPTVKAQVIQQLDGLASPLSDDGLEAIIGGAWGIVGSTLGTALAKMPMPTIAGVTLGAPTMTGTAGFAIADIGLN